MTGREELPVPSNPMAVARSLLPSWQNENQQLVCRRWRGSWMRWTGTCWRELDDQQMRSSLYKRLEYATYSVPGKDGQPEIRDWAPTKQKISNLLDALGAITLLPTDTDAPSWVEQDAAGKDGSPIVACENGLLRIRDRALLPHTPASSTSSRSRFTTIPPLRRRRGNASCGRSGRPTKPPWTRCRNGSATSSPAAPTNRRSCSSKGRPARAKAPSPGSSRNWSDGRTSQGRRSPVSAATSVCPRCSASRSPSSPTPVCPARMAGRSSNGCSPSLVRTPSTSTASSATRGPANCPRG